MLVAAAVSSMRTILSDRDRVAHRTKPCARPTHPSGSARWSGTPLLHVMPCAGEPRQLAQADIGPVLLKGRAPRAGRSAAAPCRRSGRHGPPPDASGGLPRPVRRPSRLLPKVGVPAKGAAAPMPKRFAACRHDAPASMAAMTRSRRSSDRAAAMLLLRDLPERITAKRRSPSALRCVRSVNEAVCVHRTPPMSPLASRCAPHRGPPAGGPRWPS